jgi:hypothetical protein
VEKTSGFLVVACLLVATLRFALATPGDTRPDGVPADHWIPMGQDAGFVITGPTPSTESGRPGAMLRGFFVANRNGNWVQLDVQPVGRPLAVPLH